MHWNPIFRNRVHSDLATRKPCALDLVIRIISVQLSVWLNHAEKKHGLVPKKIILKPRFRQTGTRMPLIERSVAQGSVIICKSPLGQVIRHEPEGKFQVDWNTMASYQTGAQEIVI